MQGDLELKKSAILEWRCARFWVDSREVAGGLNSKFSTPAGAKGMNDPRREQRRQGQHQRRGRRGGRQTTKLDLVLYPCCISTEELAMFSR